MHYGYVKKASCYSLGTRDEARTLPDDAKGAPKLLVVLLCVSAASADTLDATLDATAVAVTQSDDYDTSLTLGEDATSEMVVYNRSSSDTIKKSHSAIRVALRFWPTAAAR